MFACLLQQMNASKLWQWVHESYGDELGLTSSDDDYVSPENESDVAVMTTDNLLLPALDACSLATATTVTTTATTTPRDAAASLNDAETAAVAAAASVNVKVSECRQLCGRCINTGSCRRHVYYTSTLLYHWLTSSLCACTVQHNSRGKRL